jgi:hypothetical protein
MKKCLSILFVALVALAIFTSTVFAASGNKNVTFLSVSYQKGGIVLLFESSGLTKADLKNNSFYADSNDQKMYCNFVDDTTRVRCTVSKALAGEGEFYGTLAGFGFWGQLPEEKPLGLVCAEDETPWYSINVYLEGELVEFGDIPAWLWDLFVSEGILVEAAQNGITVEITDTFCAPDIDFEEIPE